MAEMISKINGEVEAQMGSLPNLYLFLGLRYAEMITITGKLFDLCGNDRVALGVFA